MHTDESFCRCADYSGEFSHWNFSMHIKRNIDELMAKANVQVRTASLVYSHLLTISIRIQKT